MLVDLENRELRPEVEPATRSPSHQITRLTPNLHAPPLPVLRSGISGRHRVGRVRADLARQQHVGRLAAATRLVCARARCATASFTSAGSCTTARLVEDGGQGWRTDYPGADINFSIRFSELTKAAVGKDHDGEPEYFVVRTRRRRAVSRVRFIHMEDAGTADLSERDASSLREYLLKGGFIWNDDFWGTDAWENWESRSRKCCRDPAIQSSTSP